MNNLALSCAAPDLGVPRSVVLGGYHRVPASQLMTVLASLSSKAITPRQFRIYVATLAMVEIREAAKSESPPRFTLEELLRLTGSPTTKRSERAIRADLNHLERIGLVIFTESKIRHARDLENLDPAEIPEYHQLAAIYGDDLFRNHRRMVPIPRRVLRAIARGTTFTPAVSKMATVAMLRCLYWHKARGYRTDGRYKVTDAARLCGMSESAARAARRKLIEMGWLVSDDSLDQWNLNNWGVRDSINLDWNEPKRVQIMHPSATFSGGPPQESATFSGGPSSQVPSLVNERIHTHTLREEPPKPPVCGVDLQSGNEKEEEKITHTHTHTHSPEAQQLRTGGRSRTGLAYRIAIAHTITGAFDEEAPREQKRSPFGGSEKPGKLDAIEKADLWEPKRLQKLYLEAVERQWIASGERDRLRFFSHAVCARTGARDPENPGPLFVFNLRNSREASVKDPHETTARTILRDLAGDPPPAVQRHKKKKPTSEARPKRTMVERKPVLDSEDSEFTDLARRFRDRFNPS